MIAADHHDTHASALKSVHFASKKQHAAVVAVPTVVVVAGDQQQFHFLINRELNHILEGTPGCSCQFVATRTSALPQAGQRAI